MPDDSFDQDEAMFLSLLYSFHAAGMQHLGKVISPLTGKIERDLDAARGTIDVLRMFEKKTAGNLNDRERRTLAGLITELQLNYVDEANKAPAPSGEAPVPEETPAMGDNQPAPDEKEASA